MKRTDEKRWGTSLKNSALSNPAFILSAVHRRDDWTVHEEGCCGDEKVFSGRFRKMLGHFLGLGRLTDEPRVDQD